MTGALAGLRVLDLTTTFSGPYCTHLLNDLGADVVKVEAPGGDVTRSLGAVDTPGLGSVFVAANRNKQSVRLDLRVPADAERLGSLVAGTDVVVHNMRAAAARKLGVDAGAVLAVNPTAVHCAITGYDSSGPYAGRPAYDDTIQAASGMVWLQAQQTGEPAFMHSPVADKVCGVMAALAISSAVVHRARTGEGQAVEVPMFETMVSFNLMEQLGGRAFVPPTGSTGYERLQHRRPYRTSDGMIVAVVYHRGHWERYLRFIGQEDLLTHDDFRDDGARNRNIGKLYAVVEGLMPTRTTKEWLAIFDELDIPATEVSSLDDVLDDEQLRAVGFFEEIATEVGPAQWGPRSPFRFTRSPAVPPSAMRPAQPLDAGRDAVGRWAATPSAWFPQGSPQR